MARTVFGNGARSNPTPQTDKAPQGTLGGPARRPVAGPRPGRRMMILGDEKYLWILVALEMGAHCALRRKFRRHHGG